MSTSPDAAPAAYNRYGCTNCGADLEYEPGTFAMKCPYCGSQTEIPGEARGPPPEHDLGELSRLGVTVLTFVRNAKTIRCEQCGATSQIPGDAIATVCPFCGSGVVVPLAQSAALVKPEGIIPFAFDADAAAGKFVQWIQRGFFRPSALKKSASMDPISRTYVPYFTYDAQAHSVWQGEAGTIVHSGKHTRIRWRWKSGTHAQFYDDVLVCASKGLTGPLVAKLEPFNAKSALPYAEELLAGSQAEQYSLDPRDGYRMAAERMRDSERDACSKMLGGDVQRNLNVATQLAGQTFRHLMLPVYVASYQYKGEPWQFMVNGQTGEVVGEAPVDWIKVIAVVSGILLTVAFVAKVAGAF